MNIDAHQHFWRYRRDEYPWIGPGMDALRRDYLPGEFEKLMRPAGFGGSVAVQSRQVPEETGWLLELADAHPFIRGVVGWFDLCSSHVARQLEMYARHPVLRGVRHVLHDEADDLFMMRKGFLTGINVLSGFGLVYELLVFPRHLPVASQLVEMFPSQVFVLDHIGKPPIREGLLEPWETGVRKLASFPNVFCKVSGMVTEADWKSWKQEDLAPYLDVIFDAFGTHRLMVGSDWPVCTLATPYDLVIGLVEDYIRGYRKEERQMVLGGNACRVYKLAE